MVRKEILRFSHVETEEIDGVGLKDFNLSVFAGEIVYLTGIHGSGKHSVRGLFEGKQRQTGGWLYIDEEPAGPMDKMKFRDRGVFVIDGVKSLSGNLTISENFFLLRPHKTGKLLYKEKYAAFETREILKDYGIDCNPMAKVRSLNQCEQYLLCIAKAVSNGARVLVVDCLELSLNMQEYGRLAETFRRLKADGISVLIIDNVVNPLLESTDRAVVVYEGRDLKVIDGERLTVEEAAGYLTERPLGGERQKPECGGHAGKEESPEGQSWRLTYSAWNDASGENASGTNFPGKTAAEVSGRGLIGIFDMNRDSRIPFETYVRDAVRANDLGRNGTKLSSLRLACIPENGGDLLLDNMAPADNLLLPSYRRVSGVFGRIPEGIADYAASAFWQELGREKTSVGELDRVERKILCIRRWMLAKAEVLFVENPDMGLDSEGQRKVFDVLREAAGAGTLVCVTAYNPFTLRSNCAVILQMDRAVIREVALPERFWEQTFTGK